MYKHPASSAYHLWAGSIIFVASAMFVRPASAHVKWFCTFDVAGQPRGLENVLCTDFELLSGLALAVLFAGMTLERTKLGTALVQALDEVTGRLQANTELLIRAVCGFFFVALWTMGGILLTPELKTTSAIVPWIQLAIAAGLLSRRTLPLSALGIVGLYALAVSQYGVFHLMDYPIFLGVAAYLGLTGVQRTLFGVRPLDIVRWAASVTLMWASIEKWAYPQWTSPLILINPEMTLGYSDEFFMRAAGVVEFALAFALMCTPLVRRFAAVILAALFLSAIAGFGKIDAIGHSAIIAVMLAVAADNAGAEARRWQPILASVGFGLAVAGFLAVYYVAHAALFGTTII